ncbi:MAG: hypothetical protein IJM08_06725 [Firmicutes bacterium]|nr:hypothetical protein [Bacillota bacterium]
MKRINDMTNKRRFAAVTALLLIIALALPLMAYASSAEEMIPKNGISTIKQLDN